AGWRPFTLRAALQLSAGSAANRAGMVGLFVALLLLAPALAARVSGQARGQVALALARLCLALLPVLVEPARPDPVTLLHGGKVPHEVVHSLVTRRRGASLACAAHTG